MHVKPRNRHVGREDEGVVARDGRVGDEGRSEGHFEKILTGGWGGKVVDYRARSSKGRTDRHESRGVCDVERGRESSRVDRDFTEREPHARHDVGAWAARWVVFGPVDDECTCY